VPSPQSLSPSQRHAVAVVAGNLVVPGTLTRGRCTMTLHVSVTS
jgi:hypothetical protein